MKEEEEKEENEEEEEEEKEEDEEDEEGGRHRTIHPTGGAPAHSDQENQLGQAAG